MAGRKFHSDAEKKLYAERMRQGRERAKAQRATALPTTAPAPHLVAATGAIRNPDRVPLDRSKWKTSGRSGPITRRDPVTGRAVAKGFLVTATRHFVPHPVPPDRRGAYFDRKPYDAVTTEWEDA